MSSVASPGAATTPRKPGAELAALLPKKKAPLPSLLRPLAFLVCFATFFWGLIGMADFFLESEGPTARNEASHWLLIIVGGYNGSMTRIMVAVFGFITVICTLIGASGVYDFNTGKVRFLAHFLALRLVFMTTVFGLDYSNLQHCEVWASGASPMIEYNTDLAEMSKLGECDTTRILYGLAWAANFLLSSACLGMLWLLIVRMEGRSTFFLHAETGAKDAPVIFFANDSYGALDQPTAPVPLDST